MKLFGILIIFCVFTMLIAKTESVQRVIVDAMDQIIGKTTKTTTSNLANKAVASSAKKGAGIGAGMKRLVKNFQKKAEIFGKSAKDRAAQLSKAPFPSNMGNREVKKLEKSIVQMDKQLKDFQKQLRKVQM